MENVESLYADICRIHERTNHNSFISFSIFSKKNMLLNKFLNKLFILTQ